MEKIRSDISEIKGSLARLDERTKDLPKILRALNKDTSSLSAKVKFHFWILTILIIIIGAFAKQYYL